MDFEKAVSLIGTVTDLRRVASAHVIDHNQLKDDDLRSALVKSKPQYAAAETSYREAMSLEGEERRQKFEAAADQFAAAAKSWPDSALEQDALFLSGEAYFFADMLPDANKQYEKLLKQFPNSPYLDLIEARRFQPGTVSHAVRW